MSRSRPNYGRCIKRAYCLDDRDDNGTTQPLPIDINDHPLDLPYSKVNITKCKNNTHWTTYYSHGTLCAAQSENWKWGVGPILISYHHGAAVHRNNATKSRRQSNRQHQLGSSAHVGRRQSPTRAVVVGPGPSAMIVECGRPIAMWLASFRQPGVA
jgi:hypothetical protein